jgi:putative transposase
VYYKSTRKELAGKKELACLLQKLHYDLPFYGRRRLHQMAIKNGFDVSAYQIKVLMKELKIVALTLTRSLTRSNKMHRKYPYLLKGLKITRPNQVWATDITYIRLRGGYVYMMAIIDLYSRKILSWGISNTQNSAFCIELLSNALRKYGKPEIFNTDQGSQYTSKAFTGLLESNNIKISMDGVGRALDNIYIERFWRTLKYENIHIRQYNNLRECRKGVTRFIEFYNKQRIHQSLEYEVPDALYKPSRHLHVVIPHVSWANGYSAMDDIEFEQCVRIFKNGISKEEHLRAA